VRFIGSRTPLITCPLAGASIFTLLLMSRNSLRLLVRRPCREFFLVLQRVGLLRNR
jgi:hypothetical protein